MPVTPDDIARAFAVDARTAQRDLRELFGPARRGTTRPLTLPELAARIGVRVEDLAGVFGERVGV